MEDDLLNSNVILSKSRWINSIDSIKKRPNETWEDFDTRMYELIMGKLKINEHREIDWYHRLSRKKKQNRPRTITCCITKFKDKQEILQNAKYLQNTGIFIYVDICKGTMGLRIKLWQEVLE